MTQTQISCFLTVADCQSFSKAAQVLYISQPAVSKQIALMEQEFGVPLFDRTRKTICLTEAGRLFYDLFFDFSTNFKKTLEQVQALNSTRKGEVHIGCTINWDISNLYNPIHAFFSQKYPYLKLFWDGYVFDDLIPALKSGKADVIFSLDLFLSKHPELVSRNLMRIKSILLYSAQHPVAHPGSPSLSDFQDDTFFISYSTPRKALRDSVMDQCLKAGFTPRLVNTPDYSSALLQIQCGAGVMLTDEWMMSKNNPMFRYLPIDFEHTVGVAYLQDSSNVSKNLFISELLFFYKQIFTDLPPNAFVDKH